MKTVIHQRGKDPNRCLICGFHIPTAPHAEEGEFVGVITMKTFPATAYRIGTNNKDDRCDGVPADQFHQESYGPK